MLSKKYKIVYKILNYIQHLLILTFTITGCNLIFAFASWVGILVGITIFAGGIKTCAITAVFKKHKSTIKKTRTTMIK